MQSVACTRPRKIREFPRNLHFHPRPFPSPLKGEKSRANRALSSSSSSSSQHLTNNSIPGTRAERRGGGGSHPSKKFSNLSRYAAFPPYTGNFGDRRGGEGEASWPSSPSLLAFSQAHIHTQSRWRDPLLFLSCPKACLTCLPFTSSFRYSSSMNWVGYFANLKKHSTNIFVWSAFAASPIIPFLVLFWRFQLFFFRALL